jgi:hypothetical protein
MTASWERCVKDGGAFELTRVIARSAATKQSRAAAGSSKSTPHGSGSLRCARDDGIDPGRVRPVTDRVNDLRAPRLQRSDKGARIVGADDEDLAAARLDQDCSERALGLSPAFAGKLAPTPSPC